MTFRRDSRLPLAMIALAASAVLAAAPPALAQNEKDEAFKTGVEARKNKEWPAVVTQMRRAILEDAKESTRKVGRVIFAGGTEYLPYYFLGEAYFRQNDCVNAVIAWETSTRQGVVRTRPEYFSEVQKGNAACEASGVLLAEKLGAAVSRAREQLADVATRLQKVKTAGDDNIEIWRATPALLDQYNRASGEYKSAVSRLATAQGSRLERDFTELGQSAGRARDLLDALDSALHAAVERGGANVAAAAEVRRTIEEAQRLDEDIESKASYLNPALVATRADGLKKLATAREQLDPRRLNEAAVAAARASANEGQNFLKQVRDGVDALSVKDLQQKLARAVALASAAFTRADAQLNTVRSVADSNASLVTPALQQRMDTASTSLEAARRRLAVAARTQQQTAIETATKQADAIATALLAIVSDFGVKPTLEQLGVPPSLQDGARSYLRGEYARALDVLVDDGTTHGPAQLQVHLFRAAALHALYVRSGERDAARRDQAIAEVKRCKALNPVFTPETRAFSPRFVEFYQRDGVPPQAASRTP